MRTPPASSGAKSPTVESARRLSAAVVPIGSRAQDQQTRHRASDRISTPEHTSPPRQGRPLSARNPLAYRPVSWFPPTPQELIKRNDDWFLVRRHEDHTINLAAAEEVADLRRGQALGADGAINHRALA